MMPRQELADPRFSAVQGAAQNVGDIVNRIGGWVVARGKGPTAVGPVCLLLALLSVGGCNRQVAEAPAAKTDPAPAPAQTLLCYAGPSMRRSMEELARTYGDRTGVQVTVESNDPRSLIDKVVLAPEAGLFVSHDPFLPMLVRQGVGVRQSWVLASLVPVIAVVKGNPKEIHGLADLARPGIRVGLTDVQAAISAQIVAVMLKKSGLTDAVEANVVLRAPAGRYLVGAFHR